MDGTATRYHVGDSGTAVIERVQDCAPIAEHATRLRLEGVHGDSEMRHAARFPAVIVERYCNDRGITFEEWMRDKSHVRTMLNDPALAAFRVWEGKA